MQTTIAVTKAATELSLITSFEAKNSLGPTVTATSDDLVKLIIVRASDEIARYCNRVFAQETVVETFRSMDSTVKLFLERYPIKEIISITSNGSLLVEGTDYEVDMLSGKVICLNNNFQEPTIVTYTGGYDLPFEAPPSLRQACVLAVREAYYAALRGDATIRMIGHKESRVIYFDPNAALKAVSGGSGGGGSAATRSMKSLLERFTRWEM